MYTYDTSNQHPLRLIKKVFHYVNGYTYCGIYSNTEHRPISRRVHRLVAEAYIPNPNHLPIVGHKNNIKSDNRVENLYWTTPSENTKKAYDDGLAKTDKGFDDSQSKPVKMFNTYTNELLGTFGSASEAERVTNVGITTIRRQAKYKRPVRKPYYFRYIDDEDCLLNQELIGAFDYKTDELLTTFINTRQAERETGVPQNTISQQCNHGKPKCQVRPIYFAYLKNSDKREQTIES